MSLESKENKEEEKIFIEKNKIIDRDVLEYIFDPIDKFDVYLFTSQLRSALSSGLEIIKALSIIADQTPKKIIKKVIRGIIYKITQGMRISDSMSYYPWMFDKIYIASIKVGEENGKIVEILTNLEKAMLKQIEIDRKVMGACVYPIVAFLLSIVFAIFTFKYVMPGIMEFIGNLNIELPWPTKIVLFLTDVASYPYTSLIVVIILCLIFYGIYKYIKKPRGKYAIDYIILGIPVVNTVSKKLSYSNICRNIATLLEAGIPITNALKLASGACNNIVYAESCKSAAYALEDGEQLSEFFERNIFLYDNVFRSMFKVGEEAGTLPEVSLCLADMYDRDLDSFFNSISSIIEPIMILFVGGIIGFIVISVFIPLYSVLSAF